MSNNNSHPGSPSNSNSKPPQHGPSNSKSLDSQQQLSVFFPSGVDSELEAVLKPLMEGTYSGVPVPPQGQRLPGLASAAHRPESVPPSGAETGSGPFPVGAGLDEPALSPAAQPHSNAGAPGGLRSLPPLNATSPLSSSGSVPVASARSLLSGPLNNTPYGSTHSAGMLNPHHISLQLVHSLATRILSGVPQNAVTNRTPELEQMLAGRFMAALSQIPGPVPANSQPILFKLVVDEILGLGPLEPLMQDPTVTEIMVNGPQHVWIERGGHKVHTDVKFLDEDHLMRTAARMAARVGRRFDRKWPMLDGRLPDGSRINIIGAPCSLHGTSITIRKLAGVPLTTSRLLEYGTITQELSDFLHLCVLGRLNIVVAGGPGSGKTTLLNALASFIPQNDRIVTVEETAEMRLEHSHVVSLETRPPDYETASGALMSGAAGSTGEVTMRHLVNNALRMRADRLMVGEIRGGEVLDLINAMNMGYDAILATMHASTPRDAVSHLESMSLMAGASLPARSLRESIATAIDLIVQVARLRDGSRRVIYVTEVRGMEGDTIALKDIFRWHELGDEDTGVPSGVLMPTGHTPRFVYRLQDRGLKIDKALFS